MSIPWEIILAFFVGLAVLALLGYLLLVPRRFLWRVAASGALGTLALLTVNFFSPVTRFSIAVNPFTVFTVGLLGLPGAVLVGVLSFLLI